MTTARGSHTATLLSNGQVLVAGGNDMHWQLSKRGTIRSGDWGVDGDRQHGHCTRRSHGDVAIEWAGAGGRWRQQCLIDLASAELYDPATGMWTATGSMATARYGSHGDIAAEWAGTGGRRQRQRMRLPFSKRGTVRSGDWGVDGDRQHGHWTRRSHGDVAAERAGAGGRQANVRPSELYDPASGSWMATDSLIPARFLHTATLLRNGRVLVSGGSSRHGTLARAELYKSAPEAFDIQ